MSDFVQQVIDRNHPFRAKLAERRPLSAGAKAVWHLVFDISGSGIDYKAGDALGVCPENNPAAVDSLLAALRFDGGELVTLPRETAPANLRDTLLKKLSLRCPSTAFLRAVREHAAVPAEQIELDTALNEADAAKQKAWIEERELGDIAELAPSARFSAQEYVSLLRPLAPRLYSVSSSPKICPEQITLTVATLRYTFAGRARDGVCSTYLSERAPLGEAAVPVFLHPSKFALPDDAAAPVIMVGPGTGIAPFRGFLQERAARGATGKNWLFFGDRHEAKDFIYKDELLGWRDSGLLNALTLAWSRDQAEKVYVHHLMRRDGAELWRWLEAGAYFYVCGNARSMAKDVDIALAEIVAAHGGKTPDETAAYLAALKKTGRYQRDVY
ncbi:MAG: hypothetical protein LBT53_07580 [Puniceicoccales bacterium]|nr:hypothetical protein [Puniceicoccales bacterium]